MKKIITSALLLFLLFCEVKAQFFNYTKAKAVIAGNLTYTDLGTNGTAITTNSSGGPMTFDNDNSSVQNIGFTFSFAGKNYTQFVLNTNGFIRLGTKGTDLAESFDVLFSTDTTATNVIYPFNIDLQPTVNSEYRVYTTGAVGSRTCTIQFRAVADSGCPVNCSPTSAIQYDAIEFQIVLYEGSNNVEFVYGNFTPNLNPSGFIPANCGLKSIDAAHSVNCTKASTTVYLSATFLDGGYTGNRFNTRNSVLPSPGYTLRFVPDIVLTNNAVLTTFYSMGTLPKQYDHAISVYVQNIGLTDLPNFPITLDISGANTFTNTQTIANFVSGSKQLITFPSFTNPNTGTNNVTISIPADDDTTGNTKRLTQTITNSSFSYAYTTTPSGNLGQSTNSIDLAIRVRNPIANTITGLSLVFDTIKNYSIRIFGVNADTPRTTISNLGNKVSTAGLNTITPASPIAVTGDFFIIVTQPSTVSSYRLNYQTEDPIRDKTFYFRTPSATSSKWNDFSPLNPYRLMVGATMGTIYTPIKLNSFTGQREGMKNLLKWETATEINNTGFEVQRSKDGSKFEKIAFVNSKAIDGNSSSLLTYNFSDENPLPGTNYYQLKQIDKNGKESYSDIVTIKGKASIKAEIVNIYPNPAKERLNLTVNSISNDKFMVQVIDLTGKVLLQQPQSVVKGSNNIILATANLASGIYTVRITDTNNDEIESTKFIKQ